MTRIYNLLFGAPPTFADARLQDWLYDWIVPWALIAAGMTLILCGELR